MGKKQGMNDVREKDTVGKWTVTLMFFVVAAVLLGVSPWIVWLVPVDAIVDEPVQIEVVVEEEEPYDYVMSCQANTILAGALSSCFTHERCNLSNTEMSLMYISGKTAVLDCKKAQLIEMFRKVNEQRRKMEEPTGEMDTEERDDTDFLFADPDAQLEDRRNPKLSI